MARLSDHLAQLLPQTDAVPQPVRVAYLRIEKCTENVRTGKVQIEKCTETVSTENFNLRKNPIETNF